MIRLPPRKLVCINIPVAARKAALRGIPGASLMFSMETGTMRPMTTPSTESSAITQAIRVHTHSVYITERSDPVNGFYFFAYRIRITNEGEVAARLISRHWIIMDGLGRIEEIRGEGVVGEQPRIEPGQIHEYTSFCPLPTPWGQMRGSYQMVRDDGTTFEAEIAPFNLIPAHYLN